MTNQNQQQTSSVHACMFNHELLVTYASGNVDSQQRVVVERHLAQCSKCRREITELERVWWSLDTWEGESETIVPRYNELRLRIANHESNTTYRQSWLISFRHYSSQLFEFIQPKPAAAFGVFLLCAFFALPLAKQQDGTSSDSKINLPNTRSNYTNHTQNHIQQKNTPFLSTPESHMVSINEIVSINQIEVSTVATSNDDITFDEVVELSQKDETKAKQDRQRLLSGYQNLRSVKVGFTPSANAIPAHKTAPNHRPTTINPMIYYERYPTN